MEEILKVLNYQPVDISDNDLENPLLSISYFFVNHPLHECRSKLWNLYKGWVYFNSVSPDEEEIKDMLFFYGQVVEMLNLSYVYTQKNKENKELQV